MITDPRLTNVALLSLAAFRVQQRRQHQTPRWQDTEGLCALLEASRRLPQRGPWELPNLEACTGMERLLAEARAWEKEHPRGS
jgi:hypothetical protein